MGLTPGIDRIGQLPANSAHETRRVSMIGISGSGSMKTKAAAVSILLVFAGGASAEDPATPQAASSQVTSEARGISLPALLAEVGGRLHKNFVLDPRAASN